MCSSSAQTSRVAARHFKACSVLTLTYRTLQRLGIVASFSRPAVSDDNPYSEGLFRTLTYTPAYPKKSFPTIEQARQWVLRFVTWYNTEHRHSGIKFVTPQHRHDGQKHAILKQRKTVYKTAKRSMPRRWKGRRTRDWQSIAEVWLNPPKEHRAGAQNLKRDA
jgi:hypothetical protein